MNTHTMARRLALVLGLIFAFTQTPAYASIPATMTATAATNITASGATLNGSWNANGFTPTNVRFEYGTTSSLGTSTNYVTQVSPNGTYTVTLSGLTSGTTYYFQAMGVNASGIPAYSSPILSFTTTTPAVPSVITTNATSVSTTSATLNGSFNGKNLATRAWFEYGTTTALSSSTSIVSQPTLVGSFSETLSGLTPGTKYYFRAVAQNANGTAYGTPTLSFTTTAVTASCVINSFNANPTTVSSGGSSNLSWNTSNCTSASIDNGIGAVTPASSGSVSTGALSTSKTYTLTAQGSTGATTATTTVTISGGTGGGSGTCIINSFNSNSPVTYGGSAMLYWNTTGCTSLAISGMGALASASGQMTTGSLTASTTYTLTGTDSVGAIKTAQTMVLVTTSGGTGGGNTTCIINSFSPISAQLQNGGTTALTWNTSGCNYVTLTGGQVGTSQNNPSGSVSTGILTGTTTFTLYAFGSNNSANQTTVVYVTGGPYTYTYACSDSVDNDGDTRIDYPNDAGCGSQYDNDETDPVAGGGAPSGNISIITTPANNISTQTARLNGILTNTEYQANAYFEYGLSVDALTNATTAQTVSGGSTINFSDTVSVLPGTTYFYRAAAQTNRTTIRGSISSFVTPGATSTPVTYVGGSSWSTYYGTTSTSTKNTTGGSSSINTTATSMLTVTNKGDKVSIGDTVDYVITYTNTTGKTIKDALLTIVLPQGFTAKQASQGKLTSFNTVEVALGTLTPGQSGSVFLQATVDQNTPLGETLVTTATLSYTLPTGERDSGVGYVLNHASGSATLGGFALGSGFFPTTIFGWLMTILIILALVLIARRISRGKKAAGGAHH